MTFILIPPGGPAGPAWGIMENSGLIVATGITTEEYARFLVLAGNAFRFDPEAIREAGRKLTKILARDFPDCSPFDKIEGAEDYLIRAVIEALGGKEWNL